MLPDNVFTLVVPPVLQLHTLCRRLVVASCFSFPIGLQLIGWDAIAQVIPDATLSTTVTSSDALNFTIENGTQAGTNLFHSFSDFSVPTDGSAVFNNGVDITHIFSRVTGGNVSSIDGLIQANGTADLFLLNPNGMVFGPNASLDIGGSFLATTADRVLFENEQFFSATETTTAPLLTVSTPMGLKFGSPQNSITVQGPGHNLALDEDEILIRDNRPSGLAVDPGRTLALVGGDIQFEGGNITAEQGRIELGSMHQSGGVVSLGPVTEGFTLNYEEIDVLGTIRLTQAASIDVSGEGSGHLHVQAGTLSLLEDSIILSDVLGSENGGDVLIRASDSIEVVGPENFASQIWNITGVGSTGTVGTFSIETDTLSLIDGAQILASTYGEGSGGEVTIDANTIDIVGVRRDGEFVSGIFVDANSSAQGRTLVVNTDFLSIRDSGHIAVGTFGDGDGGDFFLTANQIELTGRSAEFPGTATGLFVDTLATGTGGNLNIETQQLSITDGGTILAGTAGTGNGGSVVIRAAESIDVSGEAFTFASLLSSDSFSSGQGGDVVLETEQLRVRGGGQISAVAFAGGDAGNLTVQAKTIDINGLSPSLVFSGLFVIARSSGQGGNLVVNADHISVTNGGIISSVTFGSGDSGTINIQTNTMEVSGAAIDFSGTLNGVTSFVSPESLDFNDNVLPSATGKGGDIMLTANQLSLSNGGQIDASTFGDGDAGAVILNVNELNLTGISDVLDDGIQIPSRILSSSESARNANSLEITGDRLTVENGAEISVSSLDVGDAGNLILNFNTIQLDEQSQLSAEVNGGAQGNIVLRANDLLSLRRRSNITATATGLSTGGNIEIEAPFISGLFNSDIVANAVQGDGGRIDIETQGLFGLQLRDRLTPDNDINVSSEFGLDGTFTNNNPEVDPASDTIELPSGLADGSDRITVGCFVALDNSFTVIGRGGLPDNPTTVGNPPVWDDWRPLEADLELESVTSDRTLTTRPSLSSAAPTEATDMVIHTNGTVEFLASTSSSGLHTPHREGACVSRSHH